MTHKDCLSVNSSWVKIVYLVELNGGCFNNTDKTLCALKMARLIAETGMAWLA